MRPTPGQEAQQGWHGGLAGSGGARSPRSRSPRAPSGSGVRRPGGPCRASGRNSPMARAGGTPVTFTPSCCGVPHPTSLGSPGLGGRGNHRSALRTSRRVGAREASGHAGGPPPAAPPSRRPRHGRTQTPRHGAGKRGCPPRPRWAGTLQGRGGNNALPGIRRERSGAIEGEQTGELGPGANRLDMAQELQHAGAQQHHDR